MVVSGGKICTNQKVAGFAMGLVPSSFGSTLALQENIPFQPQNASIDPGSPWASLGSPWPPCHFITGRRSRNER